MAYIKVISAQHDAKWYNDHIGEIFEVDDVVYTAGYTKTALYIKDTRYTLMDDMLLVVDEGAPHRFLRVCDVEVQGVLFYRKLKLKKLLNGEI